MEANGNSEMGEIRIGLLGAEHAAELGAGRRARL